MNRDQLVEAFATFPLRLSATAREAAGKPLAAGEWGPAEVIRHLIAVEAEVWQTRLARVEAEDHPRWTWTEPGLAPGFEDAPLDEITAAFAAARAITVTTVHTLDETGWSRSGTHATYGLLDVEGLLRLAVDHDSEHLVGIARQVAG